MAITDEQVTYTMLAQGIAGTPQTLRATAGVVETFKAGPLFPALPDFTIEMIENFNTIVEEFPDGDTSFWQRCRSSSIIPNNFFFPKNDINNVHLIQTRNNGNPQASGLPIRLLDNENNVILSYDVSIPPLIYERYSVDYDGGGISEYHAPIRLFLYGDINSQRCYFAFAAQFSRQKISEYPALAGKWYFLNGGATNTIELVRAMLDESMIADDEGGAPTGDADGGGGLYDYPFGAIEVPNLPLYSVCDTGMIGLYNTTPSQMYQLSDKLWSQNFFDNIIKNFQSPMDNIISLHVVPFNLYGGTTQNIHIGNYDTEIPSNLLSSSYYEIDCGTINLTGAYKTFADYAPFTQISCYLPMIGVVDIPPDDIQNGAINIKYHIDVFSGACVAFISAYIRGQWTVVQQHQGDMITQYPVTGADYTNYFAGRIGALTKAVTAGALLASIPATGGATAPITGGMLAQLGAGSAVGVAGAGAMGAGAITGAMTAKPQYQRTGSMTSAGGLMGVQTPYLIISKPNYIQASNFRQTKGYVSNLTCTIGNESGYLSATVNNAMLTGIECTDTEKQLIAGALAEGVYV